MNKNSLAHSTISNINLSSQSLFFPNRPVAVSFYVAFLQLTFSVGLASAAEGWRTESPPFWKKIKFRLASCNNRQKLSCSDVLIVYLYLIIDHNYVF